MNKTMRAIIRFVLISSFILHPSSFLRADGGAIRLSHQEGKYRITVFSAPTPLRAGLVDISVLIQETATGEPVSSAQVGIEVKKLDMPRYDMYQPASKEAATNKLYYAALFDLPEPGWYAVDVFVDCVLGKAQVHFDLEAVQPLPSWLTMAPWVGWPVAALLLFGIHQVLVRRRIGEHKQRLLGA
jgi:hypothetical protein